MKTVAKHQVSFEFDCPHCGHRMIATADKRLALRHCPQCGICFPLPDFLPGRLPPVLAWVNRCYEVTCPACERAVPVSESGVGRPTRCPRCAASFEQPPPPWRRWQRPVAKVISAADRKYSLASYLVDRSNARPRLDQLDPRERRPFDHYCGRCGHMQHSIVWEIGRQKNCTECGVKMIVPAPYRHRVMRLRAAHARRRAMMARFRGHYCPRCGKPRSPGWSSGPGPACCEHCGARR
jgi:transcription elongation factor Elf1